MKEDFKKIVKVDSFYTVGLCRFLYLQQKHFL